MEKEREGKKEYGGGGEDGGQRGGLRDELTDGVIDSFVLSDLDAEKSPSNRSVQIELNIRSD